MPHSSGHSAFFADQKRVALLLLLTLLSTIPLPAVSPAEARPPVLATKVDGEEARVEIIATRVSEDQTGATIHFRSKTGIFKVNFHLAELKLAKLTLIVENEQSCEGLDFWATGGDKVELKHTKGVMIGQRGKDLAIEITGPALAAMGKGGRLQYVNQYR